MSRERERERERGRERDRVDRMTCKCTPFHLTLKCHEERKKERDGEKEDVEFLVVISHSFVNRCEVSLVMFEKVFFLVFSSCGNNLFVS